MTEEQRLILMPLKLAWPIRGDMDRPLYISVGFDGVRYYEHGYTITKCLAEMEQRAQRKLAA